MKCLLMPTGRLDSHWKGKGVDKMDKQYHWRRCWNEWGIFSAAFISKTLTSLITSGHRFAKETQPELVKIMSLVNTICMKVEKWSQI